MTNPKCKAKDPRTCPYHGAVIRMEEAEKTGDFDTYFVERSIVEAAERQGWVDEQIKTPGKIKPTYEQVKSLVDDYDTDNEYDPSDPEGKKPKEPKYQKRFNNNTGVYAFVNRITAKKYGHVVDHGPLHTPMGVVELYDCETGYEDGPSQIYCVFSIAGTYWRMWGEYDSYEGSEWDSSSLHQVIPEKKLKTTIDTDYTVI